MTASLKTVSLDTMIDNHIGEKGTEKRDIFESDLKIELLGHAVRHALQERNCPDSNLAN